jgi:hypothetical protein
MKLSLSLSLTHTHTRTHSHSQITHSSAHIQARTIIHTYFLTTKLQKHARFHTRSDATARDCNFLTRRISQPLAQSLNLWLNLSTSGSPGQWDSDDIHAMPAVHGTQLESAAAWYRNIVDKANEPHLAREQQLAARARSAQAQLRWASFPPLV